MIAAKLVGLIEIHSSRLANDVAQDLATNPRTPGFCGVSRQDLEQRVFRIFHHLGDWIGDARSAKVAAEFAEWGSRRFDQGIAISEIVYAIIVMKQHLRRYIRDNGLVDAAFPRTESEYVLPMHLHSLQNLNTRVGEFFDEALYHLTRGYEDRLAAFRRRSRSDRGRRRASAGIAGTKYDEHQMRVLDRRAVPTPQLTLS